jgi:hypothetical protein
MTRKQYERRMVELVIAVYKKAKEDGTEVKGKLGESIKYTRKHTHLAPRNFGSYQKAWDSLKGIREFYGLR